METLTLQVGRVAVHGGQDEDGELEDGLRRGLQEAVEEAQQRGVRILVQHAAVEAALALPLAPPPCHDALQPVHTRVHVPAHHAQTIKRLRICDKQTTLYAYNSTNGMGGG